MIPGDAGEDGYVGVVPKELGSEIERGSEVLIALEDGVLGGVGEPYHPLEALYLRAYHIIGFDAETVKDVEDHGGRGGLAVRAAYDNADLVFRLLVEVLREGVDLDA